MDINFESDCFTYFGLLFLNFLFKFFVEIVFAFPTTKTLFFGSQFCEMKHYSQMPFMCTLMKTFLTPKKSSVDFWESIDLRLRTTGPHQSFIDVLFCVKKVQFGCSNGYYFLILMYWSCVFPISIMRNPLF